MLCYVFGIIWSGFGSGTGAKSDERLNFCWLAETLTCTTSLRSYLSLITLCHLACPSRLRDSKMRYVIIADAGDTKKNRRTGNQLEVRLGSS